MPFRGEDYPFDRSTALRRPKRKDRRIIPDQSASFANRHRKGHKHGRGEELVARGEDRSQT